MSKNLKKLTQEEVLERARNNINTDLEVAVYKNETGEIITLDSLMALPNILEWTADSYVDENNVVKELVLRKASIEEIEYEKKIREIVRNRNKASNLPIKQIDINCTNVKDILQDVYVSDQNNRGANKKIDPKIDRQNLITVISLIEQCGMPTLDQVDESQMMALWLTFQHSDQDNMKKYLPLLIDAAEKGDLRWSQIALTQDRILMYDGKKQIYGSQITKDYQTGKWKLYDLDKPETVNERRAEIGLKPLQDYLKKWNIIFDVSQVKTISQQ